MLEFRIKLKKIIKLFEYLENSQYEPLINHSFSVGNIFFRLIKELKLDYEPWQVYFTGLFHDINLLMMTTMNDYERTLEFLDSEPDIKKIVFELDGRNKHSFLGSVFLKNLQFPECFQKMMVYHHTPIDKVTEKDKKLLKAINALQAADEISREVLKGGFFSSYKAIERALENTRANAEILPEVEAAVKKLPKSVILKMSMEADFREIYFNLDSSIQLVKGIAFLLDAKSPYTRNHTTIVSKISSRIGLEMLTEADSKILELTGLLHDMGKFNTPLAILHKKGPLDEDEWEIMKNHVVDTYRILTDSGFGRIAAIAASHHERLDGTGYPDGLAMSDLDMYSRILQVSDIYSALIEERPYRQKLCPEKALEIIQDTAREDKLDCRVFRELKKLVETDHPSTHTTYYDTFEDFLGIKYEKVKH